MKDRYHKTSGSKTVLNKRMIIKFFTIVFGCVGGFILLSSVVVFAFLMPTYQPDHVMNSNGTGIVSIVNRPNNIISQYFLVPERTSFLVVGLDNDDLRADVVILGVFNRVTNMVDLISIPRDTIVHLSDSSIAYLSENGRNRVPRQTKYSDLFAHGGINHGASIVRRHTEEMLGISIDYQVLVNLNAFRAIVDAVGPITMEIPPGGFFYEDPLQDLVISIPEGIQHLDGAMAEGVVRYRSSYARADMQRIEMQQAFLGELFRQTLQRDTLMRNVPELMSTFIEYVDTDFQIQDLPMYLQFIFRLNESSLNLTTLPVEEGVWLWDSFQNTNISYVIPKPAETRELIDRVFFARNTVVEDNIATDDITEEITQVDTRQNDILLNIQVLNGGNQAGTAGRTRDMLNSSGYNVISVGDYTGIQTPNTRIIARERGMGESLKEYFDNPILQINPNIETGYDIIIVTGERTL